MLLSFPTEIQSHVCLFLPRRDLASVVRTCSDLHAVTVRALYEHIELHSFDQVEAFFHIGVNSVAVSGHADSKRAEWESIKTLEITIAPDDSERDLGSLPQSLSGPGAGPLQLDRLRVTYEDDAVCLVPLLRCLAPAELGLCRTGGYLNMGNDHWQSSIPSWTNVTHVTFGCSPSSYPIRTRSYPDGQGLAPALPRATSARLLLPRATEASISALLVLPETIVQLCPNLERAEIRLCDKRATTHVEFHVQRGIIPPRALGGKPASFWSIVLKPDGSNMWGDVDEGDA